MFAKKTTAYLQETKGVRQDEDRCIRPPLQLVEAHRNKVVATVESRCSERQRRGWNPVDDNNRR